MRLLRLLAMVAMGVLVTGVSARGQCPPDCSLKGGGRPATDCLLEFDGVQSVSGSRIVECADGDPTCDRDGVINGECAFDLQACVNNADPSLPGCVATGVDEVQFRGSGAVWQGLSTAINNLLPTTENACTEPVRVTVPISAQGGAALGDRKFVLNPLSSALRITGGFLHDQQLGSFTGELDLRAGAPDPKTGIAVVEVTGGSDYIYADVPFAKLVLCLHPILPPAPETVKAGVIACGKRSGRTVRVVARGGGQSDRDAFGLTCRPTVNFSYALTQNHNLGEVGKDGFTADACTAAGGTVESATRRHPDVCNGPLSPSLGTVTDSSPGAMILTDLRLVGVEGIPGLPIAITMEDALPCGDEPGTVTGTFPLPLTTEASISRVINPNNNLQKSCSLNRAHKCQHDSDCLTVEGSCIPAELIAEADGENFDCEAFSQEDGPGQLVFATPLLDVPLSATTYLGDGGFTFTFSGR